MNKWNSKRIAFVSILIAMSISFVVIGAQAFAISSLPSVKLSLVGLPVKIVGFLFGPLTGLIVGMVTDLLSFVFVPIFYFPLYSVALGITGMLPGVMSLFFNYLYGKINNKNYLNYLKKELILVNYYLKEAIANNQVSLIKKFENKSKNLENKINKVNNWDKEYLQMNFSLIFGLVAIIISLIILTIITWYVIPNDAIKELVSEKGWPSFLAKKVNYLALIWIGIGLTAIILVIGRYKMKQQTFLRFVPILLFVILTEYINLAVIAYADELTINVSFIISYISSLLTSPIKIFMNLIIISFAIKIVLPLIEKKTFNGYV